MNIYILPKRNPMIPKHIPSNCSVIQYLTHCTDMRTVLKKAILISLSEFCSHEEEKKRLQWLASRQGTQDYIKLILEPHTDLLDILHTLPSCHPPLSRLIEFLPRLQPYHYSAASSSLIFRHKMNIIFNIIELPNRRCQNRRPGLCTGLLDSLS